MLHDQRGPDRIQRKGARETAFVQKVDRWRSAATEGDYMLALFSGLDGSDQCPYDTAAGAKMTSTPACGNDPGPTLAAVARSGSNCPIISAWLRR